MQSDDKSYDKRNSIWLVGKTGTGKQTRYTATRGADVKTEVDINGNNDKLTKIMGKMESTYMERYKEMAQMLADRGMSTKADPSIQKEKEITETEEVADLADVADDEDPSTPNGNSEEVGDLNDLPF